MKKLDSSLSDFGFTAACDSLTPHENGMILAEAENIKEILNCQSSQA
jgi:hypothetical protein